MATIKLITSLPRALLAWLGFAVLLSLAESAAAAGNVIGGPGLGGNSAWTVYAFGNAQAVADSFRALANFSSSGTFKSIVSMIAVIGVLGVGISGGFNPAMAKRFIGYIVGVFMLTYVFFGANNGGPLVANVEVIDSVDMSWKAPVTVPAVVGIPAAVISSAGYRITQAIEASFALPDALKMSNGAPFNLAASMLADASQARITDPNLASSMAYYVQDCFTIGVAQGALRADTLLWSTHFIDDIQFNSDAVMVNTLLQDPVGTPGVVSCRIAWNLINQALTAQGNTADSFLKDASSWAKTPALNVVNAAADSTLQWATNNGVTDGGAVVKQAAVLSAFRSSYSQAAAQTGNSDVLTGLAMSQAVETQRASWIAGAEIFNKTMGYIFAILQVFVYALTPLVLCASLIPGLGLALLKNFSQILLWLAIWQPMLAIVNFIILSMQQADLGGVLNNGMGAYGFTLTNMDIITERTQNLRAAASFVGTMVPALAWAMVKGSVDFSRVIGSAVGENFAAGAANTMTTGSYSLNQASMDSFTANKHSLVANGAWGGGHTTTGAVGSHTNDKGGNKLLIEGEQAYNVMTTANMGTSQNGSRGTTTADSKNGSVMNSNALSNGSTSTQSTTISGGTADSSGTINTISGAGNAGLSYSPQGSAVPKDTAGPVAAATHQGDGKPGGKANPNGKPAGAEVKKPSNIKVNAAANGNVAKTGQKAHMNNFQKMDAKADASSQSRVRSKVVQGGRSAVTSQVASHAKGYTEGQNQVITVPTSGATRAAIQRIALDGQHHRNWMEDGVWYKGPRESSPVDDTVNKLMQPDSIRNDVNYEKAAVAFEEKKNEATTNKLAGAAQSSGLKEPGSPEKADFKTLEGNANKSAREALANDVIGEENTNKIKNGIKSAENFAHEKLDRAKAALGLKHKDKGPAPQIAQAAKKNEPEKGEPAAHSVQGHQPQGTHPKKKSGKPVASKQDAGGQPVQYAQMAKKAGHDHGQPAAHGGGKGHQHDQHKPQPGQSTEKGQGQPAGQAPVANPVQPIPVQPVPEAPATVQPPPPVQPPEVPTVAAPPQQPAQGQGQVATSLDKMLNGDSNNASASNLQNQVKLAEGRVQALETATRNVDGILASADGLPASKLPDLINQARDFTRKA